MKPIHFAIKDYVAIISPDMPLTHRCLERFRGEADLSFMPPLERRRLGNAAKCVFGVAKHLESSVDLAAVPIVFSSYCGEINRCYTLLNTLKQNELLSPTEFSLSVLNANAALLAINRSNNSEITAVSGVNSFETGVFASALKGFESKGDILLIDYYEELDSHFKARRFYALGVVLNFTDCSARFRATLSITPNINGLETSRYSAFQWLEHIENKSSYQIVDENSIWCWEIV